MSAWPLRLMLLFGVIAFALSSIIVPGLRAENPKDPDILVQILGGTTDLASEAAYREADVYFHGGAMDECPDHAKGNTESTTEINLPLMSLIKRLQSEAAPKEDRHLEGKEAKEMLPWFTAAIRLNPHHIEAWRTGIYWFYHTGEIEEAEDFANRGISHNPHDYRMYLERGILYHRLKKWDKAVRDVEIAKSLWKNNSDEASFDLKAIHMYLKDSKAKQADENHQHK